MEYNVYEYHGPVMNFDKCVKKNWYGITRAVSEKKARSNLAYQYKKEFGLVSSSKISLPGDILLIDEDVA